MSGRVVITSAGVVSPVGIGLEEVFEAIEKGTHGISHLSNFDSSRFPCRLAGEVKGARGVEAYPSGVDRKRVFLGEALRQIAETSAFGRSRPEDRSLFLGVGIDYFDLQGYTESGDTTGTGWGPYYANTVEMARELGRGFDIGGETVLNVTACVASSQSLGLSLRHLRGASLGAVVLSGGVDSMLSPLHYMGFFKLGALSSWTGDERLACKPFDKHRCGLVLGEGAALFTLEREESAAPSTILAELAGYSSTMDAYRATDPDPTGACLAEAAQSAIRDAKIAPGDIDCIHLHGTGTHKNDLAETAALRRVFPETYRDIPVFSMKGQIGHLIAGCGAMELVGVLYSLLRQAVPPTVNFQEPDPEVPLRVVTGKPMPRKIRNVLKLNAAFGGQNTALVVRGYEP